MVKEGGVVHGVGNGWVMWAGVRNVALIVLVYYLLPVEWEGQAWVMWLRLAAFVGGVGLLVWGVIVAGRRQAVEGPENLPLTRLIVGSVVGVVVFALADYTVATLMPGQFVELVTKTDALYFAVSTLGTVGFGDVHAAGQWARVLVLVQMVFNLVVLAAAFTLLSRRIAGRVRHHPPE